ncbi:MAG TPA: protein-glutamate O-methyltransferase CheR [Dongiaceae bacterium]|nr:protein-glutamate O-methyltransferase CheR [Dongiaceae bacterium]
MTAAQAADSATTTSSGFSGSTGLSRRDYERLGRFIQGYSGIKMPPNKITMLEGRLRRRLRATGYSSFADYCRYLFDEDGLDHEAVHLIDAVTTNKTEFFREPDHFRLLRQQILPDLMARKRGTSPLKFWSAAASTGAEAYTIAMILSEERENWAQLRASILATDICTEVLDSAVLAIYPESMAVQIPAEFRRYVMQAKDRRSGTVRLVPELRSQVHFARLNLMDDAYPVDKEQDVIFCRNILIYFDKETQLAVLTRLCDHLRLGGYLFMGHSETLAGFNLPLKLVGPTVFQRI